MAYPVESAGSIGKGRLVCRLAGKTASSGLADLAVDAQGNLHLLNAAAQTVEVVAPTGARLGEARLPEAPVACCFARGALHVLTRKALYRVEMGEIDASRVARR
jgi:sugar lactone lactonase YvrE